MASIDRVFGVIIDVLKLKVPETGGYLLNAGETFPGSQNSPSVNGGL